MKQKSKLLSLLYVLLCQVVLSFSPLFATRAYAEQKCGTDLYNGRITDCYIVGPVNATVISSAGASPGQDWYCGPLRQCFAFEQYNGACGVDTYTDSAGKQHITYCSISRFGRESAPAFRGCLTGETCLVGSEVGTQSCNWVQDSGSGRVKFCFGGFASAEALRRARVEFQCVSNCGGAVTSLFSSQAPQVLSLSNAPIGDGDDGKFSCLDMDFDNSVRDAINWQVNYTNAACTVTSVGGFFVLTAATGGLISGGLTTIAESAGLVSSVTSVGNGLYLAGQALGGAAKVAAVLGVDVALSSAGGGICNDIFNNFSPRIQARVIGGSGSNACLKEISVRVNASNQVVVDQGNSQETPPFVLCNQVAPEDKEACRKCVASGGADNITDPNSQGLWTAFGCVKTSKEGVVTSFVRIGLGLAGGFVLLSILWGSFLLTTSSGEPKRVQEGQEMISSAVMGLIFVITSIIILKFIGVSILQIPGFG